MKNNIEPLRTKRLLVSTKEGAAMAQKPVAMKWDRLEFSTFCDVLGKYRDGQIGETDAWFLLGFDGDGGEARHDARRRPGRPRPQSLGLAPPAYLVPRQGAKKTAHIWDGRDTACRLASTGWLSAARYTVTDSPGPRRICSLCEAAWGRWK